jgi:NAD(P) transhydrogenase
MRKAVEFDVIVVGSGPAGHHAAIQAAKAGCSVVIIEREIGIGGACVHRGTIPSKTLRESANFLGGLQRRLGGVMDIEIPPDLQLASLLSRMESVVEAHSRVMAEQLARNGIERVHGRAHLIGENSIEVEAVSGPGICYRAKIIVIATGSRPRAPAAFTIDHEHVMDSDSILSMAYLPGSLVVLGAGVIASEYASIFAALGVHVTMVDRGDRPLSFMDRELVDRFLADFESREQCRFIPGTRARDVRWDGVSQVVTELEDGQVLKSDKVLSALGRVANLEDLNLPAAGLQANDRGVLGVDENCRTDNPNIYAVGDVIGPPALASTSMEQGRRAVRAALGMAMGSPPEMIPIGIYTIPEMSSVGLTEAQAVERHGGCTVGRADLEEIARGGIGSTEGILLLVADSQGKRLLGCQIIGEGATELIHLAQMGLVNGQDVDVYVENIFNFPTMAEAYRVAALDVIRQRQPLVAAR